MIDYLNKPFSPDQRVKYRIRTLTFNTKSHILWANAKTFCFQAKQVSEWNSGFFNKLFSRFFNATPVHFHRCWSILEAFSPKKQRREGCLKSKMAEKYTLNITMIVWQIEKWHRYIRHWSPSKFSPCLQSKRVRIKRMIRLKREVI